MGVVAVVVVVAAAAAAAAVVVDSMILAINTTDCRRLSSHRPTQRNSAVCSVGLSSVNCETSNRALRHYGRKLRHL